jgi:hypothetical protein
MKPNCLPVISLMVLASVSSMAQVARQETVVPLKNWATPLYWQPNQTERQGSGGVQPELQFSANQVSPNALTFIAITPCRLIDTRGGTFNGISPFSGPSIGAMTTATFPVQSATEASTNTAPAPCGAIPSIAQAYSLNLTVVPVAGGAVDYISMWPSGYAQPFVATLNDPQGAIVANAAIVPAGTVSGGISVYNQGPATANVIIDMNGFFAAPTDSSNNTAVGSGALADNTTGAQNTAIGTNALQSNTTGGANVASGSGALASNTTGSLNTADGIGALRNNTSGGDNTAVGNAAMALNTTGTFNTAVGAAALNNNNSAYNTAIGYTAMASNTTGAFNTAVGYEALGVNTTGGNNIALGIEAGSSVANSNSNNIEIGNPGVASDGGGSNNGVIRIGTVGFQTSTYIAGISGATPGTPNLLVCVDGNGQLGTTGCSSSPSAQIQSNEAQKQNAKIEQLEKRLAALEALLSSQTPVRPASSQ